MSGQLQRRLFVLTGSILSSAPSIRTRAEPTVPRAKPRFGLGILVLVFFTMVSCGGGNGSSSGGGSASPTGPTSPPSPGPSGATFRLVLSTFSSTYTATFQGQTYTASGLFNVSLAPGTYTISGTTQGQGPGTPVFIVGFALGGAGGGVQSSSVRSLSGPVSQTLPCSVAYTPATGSPANFSVQFTVTSSTTSACQTPG